MYKTERKIYFSIINTIVYLISLGFSVLLVSLNRGEQSWIVLAGIPAVLFLSSLIITSVLRKVADSFLFKKDILESDTKYLGEFIDRLRFCYSFDDLFQANTDILEMKADCSVLFIDREKNYVLYNSPSRISSYYSVRDKLMRNFPLTWKAGFYFIGNTYDVVSSYKAARGFMMCYQKYQLYVFCRYTHLYDVEIYDRLYEEFVRFISRTKIIEDLSEISSLTKEWEQLAETQISFLPHKMPEIPHLKLAAYYRPLVNVSGDYYSVLPIDSSKTLLMLGDVSGKGLPAALIMGLVMNTVKIIEDKEDLITIVRSIDKAIKGMKLQDKYTVLFISVVDTQKMTIRYVNASMSDPIIVTRAPDGYTIKPLSSNCGVVGIIDIDDIRIDEQRLFRDDLILFASDGVSEVMNEEGVELGDTQLYTDTIKNSAAKQPQEFIDDIVNLIFDYKGSNKLHDDITMMVTKVVS